MSTEVFLVDTSLWVTFFHKDQRSHSLAVRKVVAHLEKEERVVTCGQILAEFVRGLGGSEKEQKTRKILEDHECLACDKEIYLLAGDLAQNLDKSGLGIPLGDCLIASIAIVNRVTLVTDDPHFRRFTGLNLKFVG